jgi:hypothetical protein
MRKVLVANLYIKDLPLENPSLFVWLLILNKRKGSHIAKIKGDMTTHITQDKVKEKGDQDPTRTKFFIRRNSEMCKHQEIDPIFM